MAWQHQWRKHPTVRSGDQLSLGERAADKMRNGMGSWPFVFVFFRSNDHLGRGQRRASRGRWVGI